MDGSHAAPTGRSRCGIPLLTGLLDRLDDRVSAPIEASARARGWTVRRLAGTRTIEYRDSRFDLRRLCPGCEGTGLEAAGPCPACDGDGVITTQPAHAKEEQQ